MSKSLATNLVAAAIVIVALLLPEGPVRRPLLYMGLFALSGALTNWIAIHMLFERVPGFYGSGIVPARFEEFKAGIRTLILDNYFTEENFARLTEDAVAEDLDLAAIGEEIRYSELFDGLLGTVQKSSVGGMLSMVGGVSLLEKLRDPFEREMRKRVTSVLSNSHVREVLAHGMSVQGLRRKVETLVDGRLAELTPRRVKEIVQKMIRRHLGWLVIWGGAFGALLGLLASFLS